jgi:hypothetical protein
LGHHRVEGGKLETPCHGKFHDSTKKSSSSVSPIPSGHFPCTLVSATSKYRPPTFVPTIATSVDPLLTTCVQVLGDVPCNCFGPTAESTRTVQLSFAKLHGVSKIQWPWTPDPHSPFPTIAFLLEIVMAHCPMTEGGLGQKRHSPQPPSFLKDSQPRPQPADSASNVFRLDTEG